MWGRIFLIVFMSFQAVATAKGNSNEQEEDTLKAERHSIRLTGLFLSSFNFPVPTEPGTQKGYNFLVGAGYLPDAWWIPAPHFYITYTHYENTQIDMTSVWEKTSVLSLYPTIKLARFLLLGFGFSTGNMYVKQQAVTGPAYVTHDGPYSTWSLFVGLDIDVRIYKNMFCSFGMYYKEPVAFYALGASIRI
ncbi:MAG TPA: hypothetical protein VNL36_04835 [Bacteroidota bacterium]|nr:hypothetical protein [Bacteroidota bacterium]